MSDNGSAVEVAGAGGGGPLQDLVQLLPDLGLAIVFGLLGWLLARLARLGVLRLCDGVNRLIERLPVRAATLFGLTPTTARVLGDVAFWLVVVLALVGIAGFLGLDAVGAWLAQLAGFLPALLAGGLIIVIGIAGSILLGQITAAAAAPAGDARSRFLGRSVQATVLLVAIVLGVGQMGIDVTLPVALIVVAAASVGGALALAFALGGIDAVRDLVGAQGLHRHCELRQRVRVDGIEGEIVEVTATSLVLATAEGRAIVPARVFHERAIVLLSPDDDD